MPPPSEPTLRQHLAWAYANHGMAEAASHENAAAYGRKHYMIRSKLEREMAAGRMAPRSGVRDQAIRVKMTPACLYCGSADCLTQDHVVPTVRGGLDSGDNTVTACRPCNSSKGGRDLFVWWSATRLGVPPLFASRVWLKQAWAWAEAGDWIDRPLAEVPDEPFNFAAVTLEYPPPGELVFTPWHVDRGTIEAKC